MINSENEEWKKKDNMELLKQQASACEPECGCHATGASGRIRWVLGAIVLVAAVVVAARAMVKSNGAPTQASAPAFASPVGEQAVTPESDSATASAQVQKPSGLKNGKSNVSTAPLAAKTKESEAVAWKTIGAISELNTVAADVDAVFVLLPGKNDVSSNLPAAQVKGAVRTIAAQGQKVGLFTLKTDSAEYKQIATQVSLPGIIVMVKGRGMSAISGDITETKLVQGFVAASRAAGCGPAGGGCAPSTPGCS